MGSGSGGNPVGISPQQSALYGNTAVPAAQQVGQTAFDPQGSLFNFLSAQNTDATNVANSRSGVANTPYGAGLADQSAQTFNMNWQDRQLGRETQGLGAINSTVGTGSQQTSAEAGAQQVNNQGAMLPYQQGQSIASILGK